MLGISTDQMIFGLYCAKLAVEGVIMIVILWLAHDRLKHSDTTAPTAHL